MHLSGYDIVPHALDGYIERPDWGVMAPQLGSYLGQIDPGSMALEINTAIATAREFWESIQRIFGIGAGRMEANVITPLQTKIENTVLVPAVDMGSNPSQHSCSDFQKMLGSINQAAVQFKSFLTNTQWQDGRAAAQAMVWLEGALPASATNPSWFHQVQSDFTQDVQEKCGIGGGVPIPGTGTTLSWPTVALIGAGAYMLARRRG